MWLGHLFQRTPPWVVPRMDYRITPAEHWLLRWVPFAPAPVRAALYWFLEVRMVGFRRPKVMNAASRLARWHLKRQVPDPALRARLTPDYTLGCKRVLVSDDYYPALTRPNVEVVTDGVREVRAHSLVTTAGAELEVDTIILGTGFHVTDNPIAARVRGRQQKTLAEVWSPSMRAYLGMSVAGFPNLFVIIGPNTALGHNSMVFMIESQLNYLMGCLEAMRTRGVSTVEVRSDAVAAFNDEIDRAMQGTVWSSLQQLVPRRSGAQQRGLARLVVPLPHPHPALRAAEVRDVESPLQGVSRARFGIGPGRVQRVQYQSAGLPRVP
jgi:cation diffusion facilitator CzcD-associated flavoprotein CzcO